MRFQDSALASLAVLTANVAFARNTKVSGDRPKGASHFSDRNSDPESSSTGHSSDLLHLQTAGHDSRGETNVLVSRAWPDRMHDAASTEIDVGSLSVDVGVLLKKTASHFELGTETASSSASSDPMPVGEWTNPRALSPLATNNPDCETYCSQFDAGPSLTDADFYDTIRNCRVTYPPSSQECLFPGVPLNCWNVGGVTNMTGAFYKINDSPKLDCWDVSGVTIMTDMFEKAYNFNQPLGTWDVSQVTEMESMFLNAYSFNQPLETWDVSQVTEMDWMFLNATAFNQPLGSWNTAKVTEMDYMFYKAMSFNQPLGSWNTAQVKNLNVMFAYAYIFDQPLDAWDVSKVTEMEGMFYSAISFNQPLGSWNTAKVTEMDYMFYDASSFNQPLGSWKTAKVTEMDNMFRSSPFNQPLGSWDVSKVIDMEDMFRSSPFNQPLDSWDVSKVQNMKYMFFDAENFNQCLNSWGEKTSGIIEDVSFIFDGSGCDVKGEPSSGTIWCNDNCDTTVDDVCVNDDSFLWNGKNKKNCKWVAKKPSKHCSKTDKPTKQKVEEFCPLACNLRCSCNDYKKKFKLVGGKGPLKCKNISTEQCNDKAKKGKKVVTVADFCPKTCDDCL